jgi:hypothetical protein
MRRNGTEGSAIFEKKWNVFDAPDKKVVLHRMRIIEMETVVPMIAVSNNNAGCKQKESKQK